MKLERNIPKIMIIGDMNVGKSSLCAKISGVKLRFNETYEKSEYGELVRINPNDVVKDHFKVRNKKTSKPQKTGFVLANLLGDERKGRVMIIDTPGLLDPKEFQITKTIFNKEGEELNIHKPETESPFFFLDLVTKLKALGFINGLVLLLSPNSGAESTPI